MLCASIAAVAQSIDTTKAKPTTNSFSKYQQPSQYGVQTTPSPSPASAGQPNPDMVKKIEQKRVSSTYQYQNGRIIGGKTTLQFSKKKN